MDKRVLLTVAISMGILFVWTKFFMPPPVPTPPASTPAASAPATSATETAAGGASGKSNPSSPASPAPAKERPPEAIEHVESKGRYQAALTSWGAGLTEWTLLDPQYQEIRHRGDKKPLSPINLVRSSAPDWPLTIRFPDSEFAIPQGAAWTLEPTSSLAEKVYVWEDAQVRVEKHFTFPPDSYELKLQVTVENRGQKPLNEQLQLGLFGFQDPNIKPGGMFSQRSIQTEGMCHTEAKLKHGDLPSLLKQPISETGKIRWIGIDEKYFVSAIAVRPSEEEERCQVGATAGGEIAATVQFAARKIDAGHKTSYEFVGFFGPKILNQLDAVKVGGVDAKLGDAITYGWTEVIARPMLAVLKAVHAVVPNWGLAIIVLTLLLKVATWYPNAKSMRSMREMAKLKPEIDKLKTRYGEDKQGFNVAMMALYKERGISPLGGCLPMLIQMPIYIALYSMLGNSVELYRSAFVGGWISDLTAPDPYYIMPLFTGVFMFVQQKLSPTPPDPQQKTMMYMMPVMFTAFSIFLPAGLTIYILSNTLLTMGQNWWINRTQGPVGGGGAQLTPKPAKA